jgi:hypothetical protein
VGAKCIGFKTIFGLQGLYLPMFGAYYHQQKDSKQLFGPSRSMLQIVNLGYIDPLDQPDPDSSHMLPS